MFYTLEVFLNISNFDNQFLDPLWVRYCQSRKHPSVKSCVEKLFIGAEPQYLVILCFVVLFSVDVMRQIDIPSVFVSEETAISLKEEYYYETG